MEKEGDDGKMRGWREKERKEGKEGKEKRENNKNGGRKRENVMGAGGLSFLPKKLVKRKCYECLGDW